MAPKSFGDETYADYVQLVPLSKLDEVLSRHRPHELNIPGARDMQYYWCGCNTLTGELGPGKASFGAWIDHILMLCKST